MSNITRCDALQKDGLHYVDEDTGGEKILPRCKINESEGYTNMTKKHTSIKHI